MTVPELYCFSGRVVDAGLSINSMAEQNVCLQLYGWMSALVYKR